MVGLDDLRPPDLDGGDTPPMVRYMSQRDYIATQVATGMLAGWTYRHVDPECVASRAYALADAMIRESKR